MAHRKAASSNQNGASKLSHEVVIDVRDRLRTDGYISRLHYVDNGYRGKTDSDGPRMDNIFVKTDHKLRHQSAPAYKGCVFLDSDQGKLNPKACLESFKRRVVVALNDLGIGPQTKVRVAGPSVELTYFTKAWSAKACFTVDLIFCYETKEKKIYYAQPPDGASGRDLDLWTRARVSNERSTIVDSHNVTMRWSVQIQRALTTCDSTLKILTPDVIQNAIYYVKSETPIDTWRETDLIRAVEMLIRFIINAVQNNLLKKHSALSIGENVLPPMSGIMRDHVVTSLQRLTNPEKLQKVMNAL